MSSQPQTTELTEVGFVDSLRVLISVIAPTIAKGVIKRRPSVEALAQHHGLDSKALQLLQDLRKKYGSNPLLVHIFFRSQVLVLDPSHVAQVLSETPVPFGSASKEKTSALGHFEPGNILISGPEERAALRPVHEHALATNDRTHPLAGRFQDIIKEEINRLFQTTGDKAEFDLNWDNFALAWCKTIQRIALGDSARDDEQLVHDLDDIRQRANWGFMAFSDKKRQESVHARLAKHLERREEGSLVSRLPQNSNLDLVSQVAQWLFAFDAAAMATFRVLALLGCQPDRQSAVFEEAKAAAGMDRPLTRCVR
jgi:hypothetical protein